MSQALDRFVAILNVFSAQRPSVSLAEVTVATGLDKSTVHRLLGALDGHQLVHRDPVTKRYRLGSALLIWGALAAESIDVRQAADPVMRRLHAETQETIALFIRDGARRICIASYASPEPIRHVLPVGTSMPVTRAAGGQVTLAAMPEDEARALLVADADLTDEGRERILAELPDVRARGWAFSLRHFTANSWSVAAPVYDHNGALAATLIVSGPIGRLSDEAIERYTRQLVPAAREVSTALGAPGWTLGANGSRPHALHEAPA
jgi:DNA-binding IclR family transcriptional regulator